MKSQLFVTSARQKLYWVALSCGDKNRLCKRAFTLKPFLKGKLLFNLVICIYLHSDWKFLAEKSDFSRLREVQSPWRGLVCDRDGDVRRNFEFNLEGDLGRGLACDMDGDVRGKFWIKPRGGPVRGTAMWKGRWCSSKELNPRNETNLISGFIWPLQDTSLETTVKW